MTRRTIRNSSLALVLLLVGGFIFGWWYMATGRFPLAGSLSHDFGTVAIEGRVAGFTHTFELRNRTGRTIHIEKIKPGCGCTVASANKTVLEPGELVEILTTLTLAKAGHKSTYIKLVISDFGVQSLFLQADGRKALSLDTGQPLVMLPHGWPTPFVMSADVQGSEEPPATPAVSDLPEGITMTFGGWRRNSQPPRKGVVRWRGRFEIVREVENLPPDTKVSIGVGSAPPVIVTLMKDLEPETMGPRPEEPAGSP
jgi:hypothetical protein